MTNQVPSFIGGWCLIGIVAATMSTADGAILALGTVMANNVFRQIDSIFPHFIDGSNLVLCARLSTVPLTLGATAIAAFYRSNDDHAAGATGYLLIVAFDIVLATVVVPLFAAYYVENPSPRAALFSIIAGAISRVTLEFVLDKDGSLLLPFPDAEFYEYGPAASILPPLFVNASETWDPTIEECKETQFRDFTGVDSMAAPFVSLLVFGVVQLYENVRGKPLFELPGLVGYEKDSKDGENAMLQEWTQAGEVLFVVIVRICDAVLSNYVTTEVSFPEAVASNTTHIILALLKGSHFLGFNCFRRATCQRGMSHILLYPSRLRLGVQWAIDAVKRME